MDWNVISDSINYYVLNNSEDNLLKYSHQIINKAKEENSNESAKVLLEVSILLFNADKYNHAVRFCTEASSIYKSILGTNNMDYACTLSNLSIYYSMQGNYTQAIKLSKEALNICENLSGKYNEDYQFVLSNLADYYNHAGELDKAIKSGELNITITEHVYGKNSEEYIDVLLNVALYYSNQWRNIESIRYTELALDICESLDGNKSKRYIDILNNIAYYYSNIGNIEKSINLSEQAVSIYINNGWIEDAELAVLYANLADYYNELGNYNEAIELCTKALKYSDKRHTDYTLFLNNLSLYKNNLGDYQEAINLCLQAQTIIKQTTGTDNINYATSLNCLAGYKSNLNHFDEAISLTNEALDIIEALNGKDNYDYAIAIGNLAAYNYELKNYDESIKLGYEALKIKEKILGKKHLHYALSLNNIALYLSESGNDKKAIKLCKKALKIRKKILGKNHPLYIASLCNLISFYWNLNNYKNVSRLFPLAIDYYIDNIQDNFSVLTSRERAIYWNTIEFAFTKYLPLYTYKCGDKYLKSLFYDGILFSKGIILNSEIELLKLISESDNPTLDSLFQEFLYKKRIFNRHVDKDETINRKEIETKKFVLEKLEKNLLNKSKAYGDFTNNLAINWKSVQNKLSENDIAIEFVSFPMENDSIMYCALTLKKDYNNPQMIPLFEARELANIHPRRYYTSKALSNIVWKPLEKEMIGVKNVYFAPDGELYNIAIESLKHFNGNGFMFEEWNFYRLSSTRELVKIKSDKNTSNVILYGGLDYDANILDLFSYSEKNDNLHYSSTRSLLDSIGFRAGFAPLESTLSEVKQIDSLFSIVNVPSKLYIGLDGTETSFKRLSGKRFSNLHIATHGFYWNESDLNNNIDLKKMSFISKEDKSMFVEDKAMTRSGLLFSGANKALSLRDNIPEGYDDGILTAQEISALDFRGLDLLVLSACQTGLGEIKGDGVFGLQRGFKKAGAQTIMMSLWKVDDFATQMLMTEFYKGLTDGLPKQEAFLKAQKTVRNFKGEIDGVYKDFSNPRYWAAFIMLDGIY